MDHDPKIHLPWVAARSMHEGDDMILDTFRVDGQVALITGGTRGLGKAIAIGLAEAGADIALVSRVPNPELEKTISGLGRRVFHHAVDLGQREQTRGVVPAVIEAMGRVDILVNSAGIIRRSAVETYPEKDWDEVMEVDLTASFLLCQAAGREMLKKGRGKIINIASQLSFQGGMNVVAYTTAKHGVVGITRSFANAWAGRGVNVNAIAPSFFVTDMSIALQQDPVRFKMITDRTPAGRWGNPEDLAGAALFLASPASNYVHGVVLLVDGGGLNW
jgi:2-deoxy-D-gluconate 3-dehydrogenase